MTIEGIIIPQNDSPCSQWIGYHRNLKRKFGKASANAIWLQTWKYEGATGCTADPEFNQYLEKYDIDVSSEITAAVAGMKNIGNEFFGVVGMYGNVIKYGVPIMIAIVAVPVALLLIRIALGKPTGAETVAKFVPAGRVAGLLK
tara:strand:- start:182 stop:613 length:432 start_codon:yes stop_codon:yes gene_type:complete